MKKRVFFQSFDTSDNYKGVFEGWTFSSFTETLAGGAGDLTLQIPRKFDEYNSDGALDLGYELQAFVVDKEAPTGVKIASFKIDEIDTKAAENENVTMNCSGYNSELALDLVESGSNTVIFTTPNQDLSQTIKDVIDLYRTNNSNPKVNYSTTSIENTGKNREIDIVINSPLDVINHCAVQADADWFWWLDADNILNFKQISPTPDHYFVFGRDIVNINPVRSLRDVRNNFLITNGKEASDGNALLHNYVDATSTTTYGRRFELKRDSRYTVSGNTADEWGARNLDLYKDPVNRVTLTLLDSNLTKSKVDLEAISVGDTFQILNIEENDAISTNMVITSKINNIDTTTIVADDTTSYVSRELLSRKKANNIIAFNENLLTSYTT